MKAAWWNLAWNLLAYSSPFLSPGAHAAQEPVALEDALVELAEADPRKARVVELRFFAGLSIEETAEAIEASPETVMRDWRIARAWLLKDLGPTAAGQELPR